jgi:hypothetical protein
MFSATATGWNEGCLPGGVQEEAMAQDKKAGMDDIERGNVGTGDQGPGDVSPHEKVGAATGQMPQGGEKKGQPGKKR